MVTVLVKFPFTSHNTPGVDKGKEDKIWFKVKLVLKLFSKCTVVDECYSNEFLVECKRSH